MNSLRKTANEESVETFLTVITFDTDIEIFVEDLPLHGDDTLPSASDVIQAVAPRGMTRFYDALLMGIDKVVSKKKNTL